MAPFLRTEDESGTMETLRTPVDKSHFENAVRRLHTLFDSYARTSPAPLPAPGLIVTPEIRAQCERYLPIAGIAAVFTRLYAAALAYPPVLSSTPFHTAMSWADTFASLPPRFQSSANPARLLESLLADDALLTLFLFASFLPGRFYGIIGRYPGQLKYIREWLASRKGSVLHCLDAACGTGEDTYGLALLLSEHGFSPEEVLIEGWTVEPLEVWAATQRSFPHDRRREALLREATATLCEQGFRARIRFHCADLTEMPFCPPMPEREDATSGPFELILCNGLLGGPIMHDKEQLERTVGNLAQLLASGGILLAADNFHGGWKQKCPQGELRALFEANDLETFEAGEGIGGLKSD